MDGMGCRSAGQPCKLKADESEGSLKETAAVPLLLALPSTNHWTDVGRPTVNLACPASQSSSRLSLDGAVSLCAQAIMKLSVTSHTSHWAAFIQHTETQCHVWKSTDSCEHKHVASMHCWESCGWMHIFCFPHPLSFSSPPGLWLFAVKVDLINEAHDRHKAPHTHSLLTLEEANLKKGNASAGILCFCVCVRMHLPFCNGEYLNIWILSIQGTCLFQLSNL